MDPKSAAVMNVLTGFLSLFINFVSIVRGDYYAAGTGLLFCFTYLFVAANNLFNLQSLPFAVFSTFVSINAVIFGLIEGITGSAELGIEADWRWAVIWWAWAILWGSSFFTDILGIKKLEKAVPWIQIAEGVGTAWIPGVLMLLGKW